MKNNPSSTSDRFSIINLHRKIQVHPSPSDFEKNNNLGAKMFQEPSFEPLYMEDSHVSINLTRMRV